MVAMSHRGTSIARTFAGAFESLKEHGKQHPGECGLIVDQLCAHMRSAWPMESMPNYVPPSLEDVSEIEKLRAEVEAMRPIYCAALAWKEAMEAGEGVVDATPREEFEELWKDINGLDSWKANPWVWGVEFKRIEAL